MNKNKSQILYIFLLFIVFPLEVLSLENKIIFKINGKAFTSLDYEKRIKYLEFVGNNANLTDEIILKDFISANIFFEYHKINNKNKYKEKIYEIYENIKTINKNNNKKYSHMIDEENILINIKIDFIRKKILENILNKNINNLNISNQEIDLLYKFKINYLNFEIPKNSMIMDKLNELENINLDKVKFFLNNEKISYFVKQKEINNIEKIDERIKFNIKKNNNFLIFKKNNKVSLIFIDKKFETLDGLIADLYSVRSQYEISSEKLTCENLQNINNLEITNKEYKFTSLNNELKNKLINIGDYVIYNENDLKIYIILCNIKFNREKLDNMNLNKLININVNDIERKFINKYSKIYNLIKFDE